MSEANDLCGGAPSLSRNQANVSNRAKLGAPSYSRGLCLVIICQAKIRVFARGSHSEVWSVDRPRSTSVVCGTHLQTISATSLTLKLLDKQCLSQFGREHSSHVYSNIKYIRTATHVCIHCKELIYIIQSHDFYRRLIIMSKTLING